MQEEKNLRRYNRLVADETIEDFSLRYTPKSFRQFSAYTIANTAIGSISFLALEAIGATIALKYGFSTAFWAILAASVIIFITAIPISYHAAKYNIDIDLITRSAGFGYIGSTFTSLIYASFSFIFFALEAAIMAQALLLYFSLPLSWGYFISAVIIIPLVYRGITFINKLHFYTQPLWILLMIVPFVAILIKDPNALSTMMALSGEVSQSSEFNPYYFGFALGISLSLIGQIGEQVDYLRFMPEQTKKNRFQWWISLLIAGPGWIILGFLKQLGGILLASLVLAAGFSVYEAKTPVEMYYIGYQYVFDNPKAALGIAVLFVLVSQIKINVTNAYAGSLAWSNFFSRLTHSHPGRAVWMVFNIFIALMLMEMGLFDFLGSILGLYSNVAIAWISAITADLMINKPLGLSPKIVEFKRAYLYNINPVGVGSMGIASIISILAFMGIFGDYAQSYSALIAMLLALILSPLIAYFTKGKYYIARKNKIMLLGITHLQCKVCGVEYEREDMAYCPKHEVNICSLCCSLDSLCHDSCKKDSESVLDSILPAKNSPIFQWLSPKAFKRLFSFILLSSLILFTIAVSFWMILSLTTVSPSEKLAIANSLKVAFLIIAIFIMILVWFYLLTYENRLLAEDDLEEQNLLLKKQKHKESQQAEMIKQAHDSVISTDLNGNILSANQGTEIIFGYKEKELLGKNASILSPKKDLDELINIKEHLEQTGSFQNEVQRIRKDGSTIDVFLSVSMLKDENGHPNRIVAYATDITLRKQAEQALEDHRIKLQHQAYHDSLTKLPNRALFKKTMIESLKQAKQLNQSLTLFFIDLDRFKQINDSLGHAIGDKVLQEASARLHKIIRRDDTVYRLGGDEFTIIIPCITKEKVSLLAKKILTILAEPMEIEGHSLYVTSSIGISAYPDDSENSDDLLMYADSAMYKAKENGKNDFAYYSQEMTRSMTDYIVLESSMREALKKDEFIIYYQPQVNAEDNSLVGMEALIRWVHPQHGLMPPCNFLPIAEESGLIIDIDRYVMKQAFSQFTTWYAKGLNPGILAVNLTIQQLLKEDFIPFLKALLLETGCQTNWLELEVTEGEVMKNPQEAISILHTISDMGIQLAIDDFGTGYSSLSYLKLLPINKLKIDKAFIDGVPKEENDSAITRAIIALTKALNLKVIAEGVETAEQRDFLLAEDCHDIQGYFYSKPIPAEEMPGFIKTLAC